MDDQDWFVDANCNGSLFDFFSNDYWEVKACVMTCASCPVRLDCLKFAMDNSLEVGVWGGVRAQILVYLRRHMRRGAQPKQFVEGFTDDWSIGGEWERLAGFDFPSDIGRPRTDAYVPEKYRPPSYFRARSA